VVIEDVHVDLLKVDELLVNEPLPSRYSSLHNGVEVPVLYAIDLVEGMVSGRGPYCRLSVPGRLRIEPGWDGAVHVYVTPVAATKLADLPGGEAIFRWRSAVPDSEDVSNPVDAVADEGFWAAVREAAGRATLLCERWAYGDCGCRWFRVTPGNAMEIAGLVWPGSLVCVIAEPDWRTGPEVLEDDFTAFADPTVPGELIYRSYPGGADSISDVAEDFSFILPDKILGDWCAVVPDSDGVARGQWPSPAGS
jgi:hypothetical protein